MKPEQVDSLARATLAHGLIQLAVHFPAEIEALQLSVTDALSHALRLAEEAIALAPELPDGHTALGRIILCHDAPEAIDDAIEALRHALRLDAEHDPAEIALATALHERGENTAALEAVDRVLKRGSAMPQPLILRALILIEEGRIEEGRRDLERAVRLAPGAGLFHLDAARAAEAQGDAAEAQRHDDEARRLLGDAYDAIVAARGL